MRYPFFLLVAVAFNSTAMGQPSSMTVTEEYPDRFSLEATYPRFYDKTAVAEAADKAIGDWVSKEQKEFNSSALKQVRELGVPGEPYESKLASEVTYFDPKRLISVTCDSYEFLGGAHGISKYRVFNFGAVRGKAKQLTLADLFKKGSSYKTHVSNLLMAKLKEDEDATRVQAGDVKSFTDEQLNRFQIRPEGVTFLFEHYELAPYSNGRFSVELTREELGPNYEWADLLQE